MVCMGVCESRPASDCEETKTSHPQEKQPPSILLYTLLTYVENTCSVLPNVGAFKGWSNTANRKAEILPFVTMWMDFMSIVLNEVSQMEKGKNQRISLMYGT